MSASTWACSLQRAPAVGLTRPAAGREPAHHRWVQRSTSATGPAHPDEVWDRYLRPARWSEWSPQIRRVDTPGEVLAPGTTGRVHGPPGVAVDFTVTALDPAARTWAWEVRVLVLGVRLQLQHGVQPSGAGTRTWLRVRGPAPAVLGYLPVAHWALRRLVRG